VASGGIPVLSALASVFGDARFCPTGGITQATAPDWLALKQVVCVGGSWLVAKGAADPAAIEAAARAAASLHA
jgi:2-dehydro-3-deoxyphosphogluconate aldolase/(4S)-4-hydroxy-2-oxoglutarate aldolase